MPLLSEDFCRAKLAKDMRGRDERFFRDSKLTGFVLRVRRSADDTLRKDWLVEQPIAGQEEPAENFLWRSRDLSSR